jgi:K+-transporting ATPase KdpF subunit
VTIGLAMSGDDLVGLLIGVLVMAYLLVAFLKPEKL